MKYLHFSKLSAFAAYALVTLLVASCSLHSNQSVTIQIDTSALRSDGVGSSPLRSFSLDQTSAPSLAQFNCLALNVTGTGITPDPTYNASACSTTAATPSPSGSPSPTISPSASPTPSATSTSTTSGTSAGLTVGMVSPSIPISQSTLSMQVPDGAARTFQLIGYSSANGSCEDLASLVASPTDFAAAGPVYVLGQTTSDISANTVLTISLSFDPNNPEPLLCPPASIAPTASPTPSPSVSPAPSPSPSRLPFPTDLSYTVANPVYFQNIAIEPNYATVLNGIPTSFTVTPALPSGLFLDPVLGTIFGTAYGTISPSQYTITATNAAGSATTVMTITVVAAQPTAITYSPSSVTLVTGILMGSLVPTFTGGSPTSYTISPALPPGLNFDGTSGIISGTPITVHAVSPYTVTGSNSGGSATTTLSISVVTAAVNSTLSQVTASASLVPANGTSTSVITVTLLDANANPVSGKAVSVSSSRSSLDTITPSQATTSASGVASFAISSPQHGVATLTASDLSDTLAVTETVSVTFQAWKLVYETYPSSNNGVNQPLLTEPIVAAQDSNALTDPTFTNPITLGLFQDSACSVAATWGTTLNPTLSASAGQANFTTFEVATTGTYYIKATSGSLTSACTSNPVTFAPFADWESGPLAGSDHGNGVLGTAGPVATYFPGARSGAASWTDSSGNFWLLGGLGFSNTGTSGQLNDLWELNPAAVTWKWVGGSSISSAPGSWGTEGVASGSNFPSGRTNAATWTYNSFTYIYGGEGVDYSSALGPLADLWSFNGTVWTWISGSNVSNASAAKSIPGPAGTTSASYFPSGRYGAMAWTDSTGHLWLFGGYGYDSASNLGYLQDLWRYTPGSGWAYMAGTTLANTATPSAAPGARTFAATWKDTSGNFWLFGGTGYDQATVLGELGDLWMLNSTSLAWTYISGSRTKNATGQYGVLGDPVAANLPGARDSASAWVDSQGNFRLYGGYGYDSTGTLAQALGDFWTYNPSANLWAWMAGSDVGTQPARCGTQGQLLPESITFPGAISGAATWQAPAGLIWLFGGLGIDCDDNSAQPLGNLFQIQL